MGTAEIIEGYKVVFNRWWDTCGFRISYTLSKFLLGGTAYRFVQGFETHGSAS